MAKKKTSKKIEVEILPVEKRPKVIKMKFFENRKVSLISLKNQFLADGTFVEKDEVININEEYANRLLSLSKPSYKKA